MRNPFIITFKQEVNTSGRYILEEFQDRLDMVDCLKCRMISSKELLVSNEFICFPRDWLWNAWMGIAGVRISKHSTEKPNYHLIKYAIDNSWNILVTIFIMFMFSIIILSTGDSEAMTVYFLIVLPILLLSFSIGFCIQLWMQWTIFKRLVKFGPGKAKLGNYNWPKIMRQKTDEELLKIITGNHQLPQAVINIAVEELEKRRVKEFSSEKS